MAVCDVNLSPATREAVFGVLWVGLSDPPPSNGDLAVDGDGKPGNSRTIADLGKCRPIFEPDVSMLNVSVLECLRLRPMNAVGGGDSVSKCGVLVKRPGVASNNV